MTSSSDDLSAVRFRSLPPYHNSSWKLLSQGAEARVWFIPDYISIPSSSFPAVCKERYPRSYRHPQLDALILKSRTRSELRCLTRCRRSGISCPSILGVDAKKVKEGEKKKAESMCLFMEFIDGVTVKEFLEKRWCARAARQLLNVDIQKRMVGDHVDVNNPGPVRKKMKTGGDEEDNIVIDREVMKVASSVGSLIGQMHNANVIHGDLTTSNVMIRTPIVLPKNNDETWSPNLCLIDFGLSGIAGAKGTNQEEKAVDLYVLERALEATHPGSEYVVKEIIRAYKESCKTSDSVLQRLAQVRMRGRKKDCFG